MDAGSADYSENSNQKPKREVEAGDSSGSFLLRYLASTPSPAPPANTQAKQLVLFAPPTIVSQDLDPLRKMKEWSMKLTTFSETLQV